MLHSGTYLITTNFSFRTIGNVSFSNVYYGLSYSSTDFTGQGFTNQTFQQSSILSGVTTSSGQSFQNSYTFCQQTTDVSIYFICRATFSSGSPSFGWATAPSQGLAIPPCYIIATRIA